MNTDGRSDSALEQDYKKLTQKLRCVYNSIKSKSGSDNLDTQKEEFIKLFCKAFDWSAGYDDEEEEGLEFVHENDHDSDQVVSLEEQDDEVNSEKMETKKENNREVDEALVHEKKKKNSGESLSDEKQLKDVIAAVAKTAARIVNANKEKTKHKNETSAVNVFEDEIKASDDQTEASQNNDNKGTEKTQDATNIITQTKFLPTTEADPLLFAAAIFSQDTSNENVTRTDVEVTVQTNEKMAVENNKMNNELPSFPAMGNASETVQLLVGDANLARQFATTMKGNDWQRENSNKSWTSSDFSGNSSIKDFNNHPNANEPTCMNQMNGSFVDNSNLTGPINAIPNPIGNCDASNQERNRALNQNDGVNQINFGAAAIETHVVRQVLRQLILMLFSHHPNGVYESELQTKCQQMTENKSKIDGNIQYLLFNHRNVLVTPCVNRGNLLTLNHQNIQNVLEEYTTAEITGPISEHINAIIKLFPCGVLSDVLDEMVSNFYGYRLSQIVSDMQTFVTTNCNVASDTNEGSLIYLPFDSAEMKPNGHNSQVLSSAIGYRELLIALLAHHEKPINIDELESEFQEMFDMQLNACSPVINRVLKKINDPTLNQEQKQLQVHNPSHALEESSSSRGSVRSSYGSLKSIVTKFRLASNFELHYEKNRALFELFCPKCSQDTSVIKSPFKEDHRTVFMGGFAHGTSTKELEEALAEYGAKLMDCKGINFRNYGWSFVKVETAQQAEDLIARSPIQIRGRNIDVRPFIDRKRVKNHQQNRPSPKRLLTAVLEAVQQTPSGLTVAQIQTNLFHKFQFRVDGPEITKLVSRNAKLLQIKRHPIERIVLTPKMHRLKMDELKWKILKIWNTTHNTQDGTDENNATPEGDGNVKEQKVLSLTDFENEFARRYKAFLDPKLYGHNSVYSLLQSMSDILWFPQIHSYSHLQQQGANSPADSSVIQSAAAPNSSVATSGSATATTELTNGGINQSRSAASNASTATGVSLAANGTNAGRRPFFPSNLQPTGMESMGTNGSSTMYMHPGGLMDNQWASMNGFASAPIYQHNSSAHLMNNQRFPFTMTMYQGQMMPQSSEIEPPKPSWPTLDNMWSLQNLPSQHPQQPFFLPSLSNFGAFSNRSLDSMSAGKNQGYNTMTDTNQNILPLFNQFSNGSQFGKPPG